MKPILVTSYVNPDIDGMACMVAYAEFLNKNGTSAASGVLGIPQDEAIYVLKRFGISPPKKINNTDNYIHVILVDSSQVGALDNLVDISKVTEVIDHRQLNDSNVFKNAEIQIELVGAAATLITEKFIQNTIDISKDAATLLYSAIISNTLNFKASVTTDRDHKAAQWLNKVATLPDSFPHQLFLAKSDVSGKILERRMVNDFATIEFMGKRRGIAQIEMVGTRELVKTRKQEIVDILNKLKSDERLDHVFLSLVDLEEGMNIFVTEDKPTQELIEKTFAIKFKENTAELKPFLMRKQIGPLINKMLQKEK